MHVLRRATAPLGALAAVILALGLLAGPAGADEGDNRHPSGKDRSVEPGGSGTQGQSASDPDGMTNGGADKPGGPGGVDLDDQDGNNGCGNDDDFEDDNNGNCGRRPEHEAKEKANEKAKAGGEHRATAEAKATRKTKAAPATDAEVDAAPAASSTDATTSPAGETAPAEALGADVVAPHLLTADRIDVASPSAEVLGLSLERTPGEAVSASAAPVGDEVAAQSVDRAAPASLARTGVTILTLVAAGLFLVALGILIRRAAHR